MPEATPAPLRRPKRFLSAAGGHRAGGAAGRECPPAGHRRRAVDRERGAAGKSALGLVGPVPARVPGDVKDKLLAIVDDALAAGWSLGRICGVLELDRARLWRWRARAGQGRLDDLAPGG